MYKPGFKPIKGVGLTIGSAYRRQYTLVTFLCVVSLALLKLIWIDGRQLDRCKCLATDFYAFVKYMGYSDHHIKMSLTPK